MDLEDKITAGTTLFATVIGGVATYITGNENILLYSYISGLLVGSTIGCLPTIRKKSEQPSYHSKSLGPVQNLGETSSDPCSLWSAR